MGVPGGGRRVEGGWEGPLGDGGEEEAVTWPRALQGNVRFLDIRVIIIKRRTPIFFVCFSPPGAKVD